jgi:hypothetical protein
MTWCCMQKLYIKSAYSEPMKTCRTKRPFLSHRYCTEPIWPLPTQYGSECTSSAVPLQSELLLKMAMAPEPTDTRPAKTVANSESLLSR